MATTTQGMYWHAYHYRKLAFWVDYDRRRWRVMRRIRSTKTPSRPCTLKNVLTARGTANNCILGSI